MAKTTKRETAARERLEKRLRTFRRALRDYKGAGHEYVDRAPKLTQDLVEGCRVYADRVELLKDLPKRGVVGEVGTDTGAFARRILTIARPRKLHVFELDVSRIKPANLDEAVAKGRCVVHEGDSATSLAEMPDASFDWIYIDGDHTYQGVLRDIAAAVPKLKPAGLLVFNDYTVWSVGSMRPNGVARAVNELATRDGWRFVSFAFQSLGYCDVALTKA